MFMIYMVLITNSALMVSLGYWVVYFLGARLHQLQADSERLSQMRGS